VGEEREMSDDKNLQNYRLEQSKQEYEDFLGLINQYMDLKRWGFIQTFSRVNVDVFPVFIYDSERCRVRFKYDAAD
jgi:hypothetical protein